MSRTAVPPHIRSATTRAARVVGSCVRGRAVPAELRRFDVSRGGASAAARRDQVPLVLRGAAHMREFETAREGRVFGNERGARWSAHPRIGVCGRTRGYAPPPEGVDSPLADRPYDLRHACITRWLNAGVPIAEVARRVGNSRR